MPTNDETLNDLFQKAGEAADRDAERVALGLETRVMATIRQSSAISVEAWANAFFRGAGVMAVLVAILAIWTWQTMDLLSLEGNLAISSLGDSKSEAEMVPSKLDFIK